MNDTYERLSADEVEAIDWAQEPAGERIEAAIEVSFTGEVVGPAGRAYLPYSREPLACDVLVAMLTEKGWQFHVERDGIGPWFCEVIGPRDEGWMSEGEGDTPQLAVCRAVLHFRGGAP